MKIMLICLCAVIALLHIGSAFLNKSLSRVLTYVSIALHPIMIIPMLLLSLSLEIVLLIFMSSATLFALASVVAQKLKALNLECECEGVSEDDV